MILKRLKEATGVAHAALEDKLPLMSLDLSLEDYRHFVGRFFGFFAPLETQLMALPHWQELAFDYAPRQKTPRLAKDLLALGSTATDLAAMPRCTDLPDCTRPEQLLGCLYVIEGATLGGRSITRHLQTRLGLTHESGVAFFDGYGALTGSHWKAFCTMLSVNAELRSDPAGDSFDESRHAAIVAGANQTFETLTDWLFPTSHPTTATHDLQFA
jgi:heme oxygenase